jgi:hypothetical protein
MQTSLDLVNLFSGHAKDCSLPNGAPAHHQSKTMAYLHFSDLLQQALRRLFEGRS